MSGHFPGPHEGNFGPPSDFGPGGQQFRPPPRGRELVGSQMNPNNSMLPGPPRSERPPLLGSPSGPVPGAPIRSPAPSGPVIPSHPPGPAGPGMPPCPAGMMQPGAPPYGPGPRGPAMQPHPGQPRGPVPPPMHPGPTDPHRPPMHPGPTDQRRPPMHPGPTDQHHPHAPMPPVSVHPMLQPGAARPPGPGPIAPAVVNCMPGPGGPRMPGSAPTSASPMPPVHAHGQPVGPPPPGTSIFSPALPPCSQPEFPGGAPLQLQSVTAVPASQAPPLSAGNNPLHAMGVPRPPCTQLSSAGPPEQGALLAPRPALNALSIPPAQAPVVPTVTSASPTSNSETSCDASASEQATAAPTTTTAGPPTSNPSSSTSVPFSNDGSFLERFRALQQQPARKTPSSTSSKSAEKEDAVSASPRTSAKAGGFANDGSFLERFRSMQKAAGKGAVTVATDSASSESSSVEAPATSTTSSTSSQSASAKKLGLAVKSGAMKSKISMLMAQSKKLNKGDRITASADMFDEYELDGEEMEGETMGKSSQEIAAAMRAAEQLAVYVAEGGAPVETMAIKQNESNPSFWWLYESVSTPYRHYSAKVVELSEGAVKPQHPILVLQGQSKPDQSPQTESAQQPAEPPKKRRSRWGEKAAEEEIASSNNSASTHASSSRFDSTSTSRFDAAPTSRFDAAPTSRFDAAPTARFDSVSELAAYAPPHHSLGTATEVHPSAAAATSFSTKAAPPPATYGGLQPSSSSRGHSLSGNGGSASGQKPSTKQSIAIIAARVAASQAALAERVKQEKQSEEDAFEALFPQGPESTDQTALEQQLEEQRYLNGLVERYKEVAAAVAPPSQPSSMSSSRKRGKKRQKYEYDSDEDIEGGTWEHKKRREEMEKTAGKAFELTLAGRGRHHIADFLPKEEMEKFFAKVKSIKEGAPFDFSDYAEHRITAENLGYQLLKSAGWEAGSGLGPRGEGILTPINKGKTSFDQSGMGAEQPGDVQADDDEFDLYRKRMMLAYRFRPNPLNNPRRPYY